MNKTPVFEYYPDETALPITLPDGSLKQIILNPGLSFGRGFHPTTRLCVKTLENIFSDTDSYGGTIVSVLDVGCGSGILSMAAAFLGAKRVTGLDIDNMIVSEAVENIRTNGLSPIVDIVLGSIKNIKTEFDLVTANVLIGSMLPMSSELGERVKQGGLILLSGIKESESDTVIDRFSNLGLSLVENQTEMGWSALLLRR